MAEGQLYSLKWNNYVDHIRTTFASLRVDRDLIDVTLSCEGKRITAHKMLLSACSPYFKSIFKENPCQHPVIVFRNIAFDDLAALIEFIYNGEVGVAEENLASFLNTAELLEVQGLTKSGQPAKKRNLETSPEEIKTASTSILSVSLEPELPLEANPLLTSIPNISPESAAPLVSKRRRRVSPPRKEDAAPNVSAVPVDEPVIEPFSDLPLKTEAVDEEVSITSDHGQYVAEDDDMAQGDAYEGADESHELEQNDGQDGDQSAQEKGFAVVNASHFLLSQMDLSAQAASRVERLSGGYYMCSVCSKTFKFAQSCQRHMQFHLGATTCQLCGKVFSNALSLKLHEDVHLGRTKCDRCNRTLSTTNALVNHLKICKEKQ
ncbi:protein jim lovell-like isoform X4 [Cloeon dipterum]|uniref:protein jim lovell-like isoform X4 n=1 Tax=Cloeon dipterum TaxID=197152 RepID=UPI00322054A8